MGYSISYAHPSREEADEQATKDIQEYISSEGWDALQQAVGQVNAGVLSIQALDQLMGFAGVRGFPFHAFCRKYCLKAYREWMGSGDDAVQTDEKGFRIKTDG